MRVHDGVTYQENFYNTDDALNYLASLQNADVEQATATLVAFKLEGKELNPPNALYGHHIISGKGKVFYDAT